MATIKDIAEKSGYSIATVSRVLNNQRNVDKKIQDEIFACAKELDYKPNVLGQLLRTKNSRLVLCMIPNTASGMLFEAFAHMQRVLHAQGYQLLLSPVEPADYNRDSDPQMLSLIESGIIGGIVFGHSFLKSSELSQLNQQHPLVQMQEYDDTVKTTVVAIDYTEAAQDAMRYLIQSGHRRIGTISFLPHILSSRKKLLGCRLALEEVGMELDPELVRNVNYEEDESLSATLQSLMALENPPTALFCFSDNIAVRCIRMLTERGVRVPEDCSVLGFDNSDVAELSVPALTTVGVESFQLLGRRTIEALLQQIETGEKNNEKIMIPHKLILRNSVRKL